MIYVFADYSLNIDRQELHRGSDLVPVEPQVFDLLQYLIRNREHVVSKDELIATVWKGRIVSESTLNSQINAARHAIGDSGERQALIRTVARKGFRFVGAVREEQATGNGTLARSGADAQQKLAPGLSDRPLIAVLPFQNMSGDPDQEYFADGLVEEIITSLSHISWLAVISRNSTFTYKGHATDAKQVGRELGARYVLEGSVRKAANQVRITGQLIDASTGTYLWADHFEGAIEDIFKLQDQVTSSVVGAIEPKLERAEIERAKRKPTESLDAYDYYLRATASFHRRDREATSEALRLFYKAIELDPDFASAYGMAAWCYVWRKINGWMADRAQETAEATRLARRAVELGNDDAVALAWGGHALAFIAHDLDSGIVFLDQALALNSNLAATWYLSGWLRAFNGESEIAIEHLEHAMRLSPFDPTISRMQLGTAFAHLLAGRFDVASSWAKKASQDPSDFPAAAVSAASYALADRKKEARQAMDHMRRIDPKRRISNLKDLFPIRRPEDFDRWAEGLRKAGLPE